MPSAGLWSSCFQGANLAQTRRPPGCLWYMYVMACVTLFSEQCCLADHAVHKFGEPLEQHPGSLFVPLGRTRSRWTPGMAIGLCAPLPVSRSTYIYIYIYIYFFFLFCYSSPLLGFTAVEPAHCGYKRVPLEKTTKTTQLGAARPAATQATTVSPDVAYIYIYIYIHTIIYIYIYI